MQESDLRSECILSQFTKCGEIHIDDSSSEAILVCSFCIDENNENRKYSKTLIDFIDHIKWHRSDEASYLLNGDAETNFEIVELELELAKGLDKQSFEFEFNSNSIDDGTKAENLADVSEEVVMKIIDLYKKCPCMWHQKSVVNADILEASYTMLATYFNKISGQTRSVVYVKDFIERIRENFLEQFTGEDETSPWYFPHLMFLLTRDENTLDESIYTNFECTVCGEELCTQDDLWDHLCQCHIELSEDEFHSMAYTDQFQLKDDDGSDLHRSAFNEFENRFIETYKENSHLWNKNDKLYNHPRYREESYNILLKILQEKKPEANKYDVIGKIKYFRTRFLHERRKIKKFQLLGIEYKPRIWYFEKLLFLNDEIKEKSTPTLKPPAHESLEKNVQGKTKPNNWVCNICEKIFTDGSIWLDHIQCSHGNKAFQSEDGFFYCPLCDAQSKSKRTLIRHMQNSHINNWKICQDCGIKFRFMSELATHRAKLHNDHRPFKCAKCGKGFPNISRMKIHSVIHWKVADRPHECEYCGIKFSNSTNLKVHIRRHTKDFYLRCEICEHMSATTTELRFHMFTHTKEYPFICDMCGKGLRSNTLLMLHQKEYHSDKSFECHLCEKKFMSLKKLEYHYDSHKAIADHECETCGKKFFRNTSLKKHMRLNHYGLIKENAPLDDAKNLDDGSGLEEELVVEQLLEDI